VFPFLRASRYLNDDVELLKTALLWLRARQSPCPTTDRLTALLPPPYWILTRVSQQRDCSHAWVRAIPTLFCTIFPDTNSPLCHLHFHRKSKEAEFRALQKAAADADALQQLEMELHGMELEQVGGEACCPYWGAGGNLQITCHDSGSSVANTSACQSK
jgi:hypothetical protein